MQTCACSVPIWIGIKLAKLASGIKLAIPVSRSVLNLHPAADPRYRFLDVHATPTHRIYQHNFIFFILESMATNTVLDAQQLLGFLTVPRSQRLVYTPRGLLRGITHRRYHPPPPPAAPMLMPHGQGMREGDNQRHTFAIVVACAL